MENMPLIEETTKTAFEVITIAVTTTVSTVKSLTQFFQEHWNILQPILAGIAAGAVTFGIYTLAINAAAIATGIWTTVTTIATTAGTAFGVVLTFLTSPIGLVIIAIGLLVAAGIALYENWDVVKKFLGDTWDWIKNEAEFIFNSVLDFFKEYGLLILGIITGPAGWAVLLTVAIIKNWTKIKETTMEIFDSIKKWIVDTFKDIKEFFTEVAKDFLQIGKDIFNNMWDGLKNVWSGISSWVSEKVSWLANKLTFWKSSQSQMNSSSGSDSTPARANGGSVVQGQQYMVGERGAELFVPNQSGTIVPNNKLKTSVANGVNLVINNPLFIDEIGADLIMDQAVNRLRMLGVT